MTKSHPRNENKIRRCPICDTEVAAEKKNPSFPFCTSRCRTIDLASWRDEQYVISRSMEQQDLEENQ